MSSHVSKKILTGSVATLAVLAAFGFSPAYADPALEVDDGSTQVVEATQDLSSEISGSNATVTNNAADDVKSRNGDVDYHSSTFNAPGVYTIQNQTGLNNSGNNGTNIAAQVNVDGHHSSLEIDDHSSNRVHAHQTMSSSLTGSGSDSSVTNHTAGGVGFFGGGDTAESRTGDVDYDSNTFDAPGLYTLQNNTGNNVAANNATQVAAQLNDENVDIDDHSSNKILAHQDLTAYISGNSSVSNTSDTGDVFSRTGDVDYDSSTFNAPGVFTIANNTGMNNAGNNATNISAQLNGQSAIDALASIVSP